MLSSWMSCLHDFHPFFPSCIRVFSWTGQNYTNCCWHHLACFMWITRIKGWKSEFILSSKRFELYFSQLQAWDIFERGKPTVKTEQMTSLSSSLEAEMMFQVAVFSVTLLLILNVWLFSLRLLKEVIDLNKSNVGKNWDVPDRRSIYEDRNKKGNNMRAEVVKTSSVYKTLYSFFIFWLSSPSPSSSFLRRLNLSFWWHHSFLKSFSSPFLFVLHPFTILSWHFLLVKS